MSRARAGHRNATPGSWLEGARLGVPVRPGARDTHTQKHIYTYAYPRNCTHIDM